MFIRLAAAAIVAVAAPLSAMAATQTLTVNLTVTADNTGNFLGDTGVATLTYDDADLVTGFEELVAVPEPLIPGFPSTAPSNFDFTLDIFGQTFTDVDDQDSILGFLLFPAEWNLSISETDLAAPTAINNPAVLGFATTGFLIEDFLTPDVYSIGVVVDDIAVAPIPLPATAPLLGAGLLAMGAFLRRRRKAA